MFYTQNRLFRDYDNCNFYLEKRLEDQRIFNNFFFMNFSTISINVSLHFTSTLNVVIEK